MVKGMSERKSIEFCKEIGCSTLEYNMMNQCHICHIKQIVDVERQQVLEEVRNWMINDLNPIFVQGFIKKFGLSKENG